MPKDGGKAVPVEDSLKLMFDKQFSDLPDAIRKKIPIGKEVYQIEPTKEFPNGTSGRVAVMEVLEMNKEIEAAILKDPTEQTILKVARAQGMLTMKEDAILKAFNRIVPIEEVNTL